MKRDTPRDESLGTVHIWTKDAKVPAIVGNLLDERVPRVSHRHSTDAGGRHDIRHDALIPVYYVHGGNDSSAVQRLATRVGALHGAICLPAAADWLAQRIAGHVNRAVDVVVIVKGGAY